MSLERRPPTSPPEKLPDESISVVEAVLVPEEPYFRRLRKRTSDEMLEYLWRDLAIEIIPSIILGLLLGGWTLSGLFYAGLLVCVSIVVAYIIHLTHAAYVLDKEKSKVIATTQSLLKSQETKLTGEIEKVYVDAFVDCFLIIKVRVASEGAATTISGFSLTLKFEGETHEGESATLNEYFVERREYHSVAWETQSEVLYDPLKDLAKDNDALLVRGAHKTGWLRFAFILGAIDTKFIAYDGHEQLLKEGVKLILTVYDAYGNPHPINYVSLGLPSRVVIRRFPKP